ncbi:dephospho-CoA kinase [Spiroplasma corruscae]|uniref:Dephospho-CoA kinase n=1 Tax=Spiroplasma corruscae TaxID=216934 RepID=A0A222EP12_9MOLU|nr:dephospho-CoA kinase [Spiroplasma corruscae]ASP28249.1 dephospho-CoA kinase [Spiroplasma corruscae]
MIKILGLYGNIGSGKTTLINYLLSTDIGKYLHYISADLIGKSLLDENIVKLFIKNNFEHIIKDDTVDKSKLRDTLFNNPSSNKLYSNFIWPLISKEINNKISKISSKEVKIIIVEASVIDGLNINYNYKLLVCTKFISKKLQYKNIIKRDLNKTNYNQLKNIYRYQKKLNKQVKWDYKIKNNYKNIKLFFDRGYKIIKNLLIES